MGALLRTIVLVSIASIASACAGGTTDSENVASVRDCEQLRRRLVSMRLSTVTADADQHAAAIEASFGDDFVRSCVANMSRAQVRCGSGAKDAVALAACARL